MSDTGALTPSETVRVAMAAPADAQVTSASIPSVAPTTWQSMPPAPDTLHDLMRASPSRSWARPLSRIVAPGAPLTAPPALTCGGRLAGLALTVMVRDDDAAE